MLNRDDKSNHRHSKIPIILPAFTWLRFSEQNYGKWDHLAATLESYYAQPYVYATQIHQTN